MKSGIRRKVDDLGRVVIPAGIRRSLGIREGDALEVSVEGEEVILSKPVDQCVFCHGKEELKTYRGKAICHSCSVALGGLDTNLSQPSVAEPAPPTVLPWTVEPSPPLRPVDDPGERVRVPAREAPESDGRQEPPTTAW